MENVLAVVPIITSHRPDKYTCYCHECTMQRIEEREQQQLIEEQRQQEFVEKYPIAKYMPTITIILICIYLLINLWNIIRDA